MFALVSNIVCHKDCSDLSNQIVYLLENKPLELIDGLLEYKNKRVNEEDSIYSYAAIASCLACPL